LRYIFLVIYQSRERTRFIYIKSMFVVLLGLSNVLTTSTVYGTLNYNHFFLLPVYLGVVILQLCKTKDKILLT